MEKILIFIKHHFKFLWKIIECVNCFAFSLLYKSRMEKVQPVVLKENSNSSFTFRRLDLSDADSLHDLIHSQEASDLKYFQPHDFDPVSIRRQFKNRSFIMMGAFDKDKIVGYFFLRFFFNKKSFVGRIIDKNYRGMGIGNNMNRIMYETAWEMGFRCLATISRNNIAIIRAHAKNRSVIVLKELRDNYLLVEFVSETKNSEYPRVL